MRLPSDLDALRAEVQRGLDQLDQGEGKPFDDEAVKRIIRRGRKRLGQGQPDKQAEFKKW